MQRSTVTTLALAVFVLVGISFVVRGFGQLIVGPRRAAMVAGPIAVLAAALAAVVVAIWLLGRIGLVRLTE